MVFRLLEVVAGCLEAGYGNFLYLGRSDSQCRWFELFGVVTRWLEGG